MNGEKVLIKPVNNTAVDKKARVNNAKKLDKTQDSVPNKTQDSVPVTWFVLTIIAVVIISFIISLVVFGYLGGSDTSLDSGRIVVQVNPDLGGRSGKITVDVVGNVDNSEKGVSS